MLINVSPDAGFVCHGFSLFISLRISSSFKYIKTEHIQKTEAIGTSMTAYTIDKNHIVIIAIIIYPLVCSKQSFVRSLDRQVGALLEPHDL